MLLSAVSVLVVAQSSSEIPEGLMNNPIFIYIYVVCPESNENDFFAQHIRTRKGEWGSRQVEREHRYKV